MLADLRNPVPGRELFDDDRKLPKVPLGKAFFGSGAEPERIAQLRPWERGAGGKPCGGNRRSQCRLM